MDRWLVVGFNEKEWVVDGVVLNFIEVSEDEDEGEDEGEDDDEDEDEDEDIKDDDDDGDIKDDDNIGIVGTEATVKDDY